MYNRKCAVGHGVRTVTVARRQEVVGVSPKEEELLLLLRCTLVIFMTAIIFSTNNKICAATNCISMCHRAALSKTIVPHDRLGITVLIIIVLCTLAVRARMEGTSG